MTTNTSEQQAVPFWRDERYLQVIIQVVLVGAVVGFIYYLIHNLVTGLEASGQPLTLSFLKQTAQFDIGEKLIEYSRASTYARAFLVGLLNTIKVSFLGIILATILGIIIGVARLSNNWLINKLASIYVEFLRNIPLLVLLVFLAAGVFFKLPKVQHAVALGKIAFLTNRGVFVAWGEPTASWPFYVWALIIALFVALVVAVILIRQGRETGRMPLYWLWGTVAFLVVAAIGWIVITLATPQPPLRLSLPELAGRNFKGGTSWSPEFMALLLGLVIYTAAYIAEVVRAGIQSVSKGQREAAGALGLSGFQTMRLVVFPQALRVIVPPLTSQYLNLTKNSSLAIAVGYPDLFAVGGTIINQSGRAIEAISLTMMVYLTFSLITSLFMNWYNQRIRLVER
ncbi:MAG TPA: ABC transporter permease subunit [Caldilineae bacterium]|nr:ABC transporter permease subunit [Caldilineae bacterium]